MTVLIEFCNVIFSKIVYILDSISFNGSPSLLKYILSAIIIGFIIKLVKGGANEFEHSMNFSTPSIIQGIGVRYGRIKARKQQIIQQKKVNNAFRNGYVAGVSKDKKTFKKAYSDSGANIDKGY